MLGTVNIKVRPLKLALLVDPGNALQAREAIRLASSVWGGMFCPIIPMYKRLPRSWDKEALKPPPGRQFVEGWIDAFDPDFLVQFGKEVPDYITESQLKIVDSQKFWLRTRNQNGTLPAYGVSIFDLYREIFNESFKFKPRYPLKVTQPTIPKQLGLFWASVFGEYPVHISDAVTTHLSSHLDIERPSASAETFFEMNASDVVYPRRLTSWGLEAHGDLRFGRHACIFFMDASSIEDVIDYWNLRATGRSVIPLPHQFLLQESFKKTVQQFIMQERRESPSQPGYFDVPSFIRSRNSTLEEMSKYADTLKFEGQSAEDASHRYFSLQHWYPRIWDGWARSRDGGVVANYSTEEHSLEIEQSSQLDMRIKPIVPKFAEENWLHSDGLCANEFDLRMYGADEHLAEVYPKARGKNLLQAISGITGLHGDWRVGQHGLVKIVKSLTSESRKVPPSEAIFFAWLADHGWKAELSSPGILAKQIYKRLSGTSRLIANKSVLGLFEYMNGGSVNRDGSPGTADRIGGEREVSVGEVKSRLGGSKKNSFRYDDFVERGVFKLGLRTKCPNCQRNTWFALPALRETLDCPKCLTSFTAAGNIDQSTSNWFYRTTGPFSVANYADGAFAVLLTLDAIGDRRASSMRTTSVPSFLATAPGKQPLEADLAMFWRETSFGEDRDGLLFGECKTYGLFESRDFERMRYLGSTFPGAVLVFSTLRESLTPKEVKELTRLVKAGRKYWKNERPINPVLILTGRELFSWQGAPYCWTDAERERFPHLDGLIALCDATQQLYLGLPSWHDGWSKEMRKKMERNELRARSARGKAQ